VAVLLPLLYFKRYTTRMGTTYPDKLPLESENYSSKRRFFDIWFVIKCSWLLARRQILELSSGVTEAHRLPDANSRLSGFVALCWLGPTFIKIGQLFSLVPIYFPANTKSLPELQDKVPAAMSR